MYKHKTEIRVRYGETDKMGYLYYGYYALYYEVGRTEAIRALGETYKEMEDNGILMPVARMTSKYVLPAKYDDLLTVETSLAELPTKFIDFRTEIFNEAGDMINIGEVRLLFVHKKTRKVIPAPDYLLEKLSPYFE